jgi:large subunit ribosomal protein L21
MYAVIVSGGKQHRVKEGETLKLEKLEVETGGSVEFDRVLLVANGDDVKVGAPVVDGAKVTAEVVSHGRHDKINIISGLLKSRSRVSRAKPSNNPLMKEAGNGS